MVPPGPPTPLLRSNSGLMGGQGSQRGQFNGTNMIGNVSSLLHQSYNNGGLTSGISSLGSSQRGVMDAEHESDPLSVIRNGMGCNVSSGLVISNASGHMLGQQFASSSGNNQILSDNQSAQQLESQNFQQSQQSRHHQQQQYQIIQGGVGQVKLESPMTNYQHGQSQTSQQLQALRNLAPVKMELQPTQSMSNLPSVKLEPQHSDQSILMQQQQQQQFLNASRQSPQAAAAAQINLLHQQRLLQLHQQQQLMKSIPQQRPPMQPQIQQQNLALRSPAKPVYEPGTCARRLTHYMYQQQHRPEVRVSQYVL